LLSLSAARIRTLSLGEGFWLEAVPLLAKAAKSVNNNQDLSNNLYFHQHRRMDRISCLFSSTSPDAPKP
jgi:hypothetical protein